MSDFMCHIDMSKSRSDLKSEVKKVWGRYMAYHIFNLDDDCIEKSYEDLASYLGEIRVCHSANSKSTPFSKSRDIKPNKNLYHFFSSSSRQPLHTDYAYYEEKEAPEWLMLYCMKPSKLGGKTHLISVETLKKILKEYNPDLLKKIKVDVFWKYNGNDGDKIHVKPIYDGKNINWNYWQINKDLNTDEVVSTAKEFFSFLEDKIVGGGIYDFSKSWNRGDCIIFNDKAMLHGRDSFLGEERWLKDHAFFDKKQK